MIKTNFDSCKQIDTNPIYVHAIVQNINEHQNSNICKTQLKIAHSKELKRKTLKSG